jgi:SAM-dependent methyltransferase
VDLQSAKMSRRYYACSMEEVEPMPEWWSEFFFEAWPRIQAGGYALQRTEAECSLIVRVLSLAESSSVLDVPCGIGRHSVELARRGFSVTGVDINEGLVAIAQENAQVAGVSATFVRGDMRSFVAPGSFDAAVCFFGSFGYFDDEGDRSFVRSVRAALRPGGQFLIDTHIAETMLPIHRERDWFWGGSEASPLRILEEREWRPETGRIEGTWTLVDTGVCKSFRTSIRIYTYRELMNLMKVEGFTNVRLLDGKTGEAFRMGASRALVIAAT